MFDTFVINGKRFKFSQILAFKITKTYLTVLLRGESELLLTDNKNAIQEFPYWYRDKANDALKAIYERIYNDIHKN